MYGVKTQLCMVQKRKKTLFLTTITTSEANFFENSDTLKF